MSGRRGSRGIPTVRVPRTFLDDHRARGARAPAIRQTERYHYRVRADDPALDDLLVAAEDRAEAGVSTPTTRSLLALVAAAHATVHAIRRHREGVRD